MTLGVQAITKSTKLMQSAATAANILLLVVRLGMVWSPVLTC